MSVPPPQSFVSRNRVKIGISALLVVVAVSVTAVWLTRAPLPPPPPTDFDAALSANARGVGRMERFEYGAAQKEFAEAVRLAPDWLPARINLAIATFNQNTPAAIAAAQELFAEVLAGDPDNTHAHYCLGIILMDRGRTAEAHEHFTTVNRLDPADAHTWLRMGMTHPGGRDSAEARAAFERALQLNPYLNAARYNLLLSVAATDPQRAKRLEAEFKALVAANWEAESGIRYGEMGKYADVIGRDPAASPTPVSPLPVFELTSSTRIALAPDSRWATAAALDPLRKATRERFGAAIVLFDFNRDGRLDLFLPAAVVEKSTVRDLLLRNDGNGAFTDVTAAAGLGGDRATLGAAAGDYDNDGHIDLALTMTSGVRLLRNTGAGTFADASAAAGLDKLKGVFLGCGWLDIDQDGDLDLLLCRYSESVEATGAFTTTEPKPGGTVVLCENVGEAPPGQPNVPGPGLATRFQRSEPFAKLVPPGSPTGLVFSDLDSDRDLDVLVLLDGAAPVLVANDRLLRFHAATTAWAKPPARWNGGLVFDANHDERSDLFLVAAGAAPTFLLSMGEKDFAPGTTNSPALKQAVGADVDLDGWADVVALGADGRAALLHNAGGGKLEHMPDAFGPAGQLPALVGVNCADLDGDTFPDLIVLRDSGLEVRRNLGNGNRALLVEPTGRRDAGSNQRTNTNGIGTWLIAQVGSHWTGAERTTTAAGLGQSLLPTTLGLGKAGQADALRARWPDAVIQAEVGVNAGLFRLIETNRKGTSCPVLMAWDGERFVFVTDFLGAGALGETGPDGALRPPRGEESVKIEAKQLAPKDGRLLIKVAEPMDEVLYLDHLRLVAVDHPAEVHVFPDERFTLGGPPATQELLAFRMRHAPARATDNRDRDVTDRLRTRDRRAVDDFAVRSWLGFAEEHSVTLDFGAVPAAASDRWFLVLAGWTEYPYPESIFAATRAGVVLAPPVVEQLGADGKTWAPVCDLGFPAGLLRVMTRELPKFAPGAKCVLRIRTNMQIYWDQIHLCKADDFASVARATVVEPQRATLAARGFMPEIHPGGRPPVAYDDARTEPVAVTKWRGDLTRLGDVTELLRAADDRFVLCGPGDEITVAFAADKLPELPVGWTRSFVLRSWGYCKDTSTTTVTGGTVGPLPFRAMPNYPDFGRVTPPATDTANWHTRPASGR